MRQHPAFLNRGPLCGKRETGENGTTTGWLLWFVSFVWLKKT